MQGFILGAVLAIGGFLGQFELAHQGVASVQLFQPG